MSAYVARRLLWMIPTLFGVSVLVFVIFNVIGDDPVYLYLGKSATADEIAALRHEFGLDRSLLVQYLVSMKRLVTFDLGFSMSSKEPIARMFAEGIGPSLAITLPALVLYTLLSLALGLCCAWWRGRLPDKLIVVGATFGMALSYVAVMLFAQYFLAFLPAERGVDLFPITGWESGFPACVRYILLPNLISTFVALGYDTRFFRALAVEEISRDYVRTARAYGASARTVLFRHVLRNLAVPVTARVMVTLPHLVAGSFLLESFFSIPGLGQKLLAAIQSADFPVIQAFTMLIAFLVVVANTLADVVAAMLDPRVKLG